MRNAHLSFFVSGIISEIRIFLFRKVKLWYTEVQKKEFYKNFIKIRRTFYYKKEGHYSNERDRKIIL